MRKKELNKNCAVNNVVKINIKIQNSLTKEG